MKSASASARVYVICRRTKAFRT